MRVVRAARRKGAQEGRRRPGGERQPGHREGARRVRPRDGLGRAVARGGRPCRLQARRSANAATGRTRASDSRRRRTERRARRPAPQVAGQPRRGRRHDGAHVPAARHPDRRARADPVDRRRRRPVLGGCADLSRRLGRGPPRRHEHAHAHRRRHERRLRLQRLRHALAAARRRVGLSERPVLRDGRHHHCPDPARPLAGSAREEEDGRRDPRADGPPGAHGAGAARRREKPTFPSRPWSWATWCACGRAKRCRSTAWSSTASRRSTKACSPAKACPSSAVRASR